MEVQLRRRHSTRSPTQPDRRRRRKVDANQAEKSPSQIPVPSSPAQENEMKQEVTEEEAAELPAQQSSHSWLPQPLPLAAALVPPPPWHRHSQPGRAVFACVYEGFASVALVSRDACNVCLSRNLRAGDRMKDEGTKEEVAELPAQQASHSWLSPATALVPPPPRHRYSQPGQRLACMCGFALHIVATHVSRDACACPHHCNLRAGNLHPKLKAAAENGPMRVCNVCHNAVYINKWWWRSKGRGISKGWCLLCDGFA